MSYGYVVPRHAESLLLSALGRVPAVILVGARQTGKSELARKVAASRSSQFYDLEDADDFAVLREGTMAELRRHSDRLVVIDEVQRMPELFAQLRVMIDELRSAGRPTGRFLLLGSVTGRLQRQSEGLTGRSTDIKLHPFNWLEVRGHLALTEAGRSGLLTLWNRGGYPESLLAANDSLSNQQRRDYIAKTLYADILSVNTEGRASLDDYQNLLRLLAARQKDTANKSGLASDLGLTLRVVESMLTNLEEMMLIRKLPAYAASTFQRVAKSPKYYICDSGILHTMLGKNVHELDSKQRGASWEGFVIGNLCAVLPRDWQPYFFRTHGSNHEVDLLLQRPGGGFWAVEIKAGQDAGLNSNFLKPLQHLAPERTFVVRYGEDKRRYIGEVEVLCLTDMMNELLAAAEGAPRAAGTAEIVADSGSSLAEILQALNADNTPLINLRRTRFAEHFCRRFEVIIRESSDAADQARRLWAQNRNELLKWLAAESARAPRLPAAEAWLETLVGILEHTLNAQPPYAAWYADFCGACRHDLFVHAVAVMMHNKCFAAIHKLASGKYYRHGEMLSSACFWVRPILDASQLQSFQLQFGPHPSGTAKQYAAEEFLFLDSPLPLASAIEAELLLLLGGILLGHHHAWVPKALFSRPAAPDLPFFTLATESPGAKNLLTSLGFDPDATGMASVRRAIAERLESEKLADTQGAVDWQRIELCLNMRNWHDLK